MATASNDYFSDFMKKYGQKILATAMLTAKGKIGLLTEQ